MTATDTRTTHLRIWRGEHRDHGHFDEYEVPYGEGASVLDALIWIRANLDDSLAIRYSCTNANVCKECLVRINGAVEYACMARLRPEPLTIEPLSARQIIRDLVTDIIPPQERLPELA